MTDYSAPVPSKRRKGGQPGNQNAFKHGRYSPRVKAERPGGMESPPGSRTGEIEGVVPLLSAGRLRRHH